MSLSKCYTINNTKTWFNREANRKEKLDDDSSESDDDESKQDPIPRSFSSYAVKDWNQEFQRLLQEEDNYEKFVNLGQLAQEFGMLPPLLINPQGAYH